jgi:hypothetical protein
MKSELPLAEMSLAEKLEAMERLWTDFSRHAPEHAAPAWHAEILEERERRLAAGEEEVLDWEEAKRRLRQEIHEGHILESARDDLRAGYNFYERQNKTKNPSGSHCWSAARIVRLRDFVTHAATQAHRHT